MALFFNFTNFELNSMTMATSVKEKILDKIEKIENPVLLRELELYLNELEEHDYPSDNILLDQSINRAISESESGLGIKHEDVWQQLRLK